MARLPWSPAAGSGETLAAAAAVLLEHLPRSITAGWGVWADGRIEELGRPFRHAASPPELGTYLWAIAVPAAACLLGWVVHRIANRPPRAAHSLPTLTHDLYRLHRVGMRQRRLLEEVARAADVGQPALLLVVPDIFDQAAEAATRRLRLSSRESATLATLRRRLFSDA